MSVGAITVNEGTQSNILTDTAGTQEIGVVKIDTSAAGTYGSLWSGAVSVSSGSVSVIAGTINSATAVINSATISVLPNLPQGSINVTAGTIATLGTMGTLGLVNTVTTVSNLTNGSIKVTAGTEIVTSGSINVIAGTITAGTLNNLVSGTINAATAILNSGTINVGTVVNNGGTVSEVTNGSIVVTLGTMLFNTGTVTRLSQGSINVTAGTVNAGTINLGTVVGKDANAAAQSGNPIGIGGTDSGGTIRTWKVDSSGLGHTSMDAGTLTAGTINTGTINSGTINAGTFTINSGTLNSVQINPQPVTNTISHAGTSGTLGIGTLVAAPGASTAAYITNFRIIVISGTPEVVLAFGTQTNGPQVIHHGLFPAGGGITSPISYPHGYGTTNSPLTYQILSGAGTVSWDVDYFAHT